MIVVDTSVLVDALTGRRRSGPALRQAIGNGERLVVPSLVLYEWLRGPREPAELAAQEAVFPKEAALPFGPPEAVVAARLYREVRGARARAADLAIAACALTHSAPIWTLNPDDFRDIPGLDLFEGPA
ncbi:MAG: PIN domain-containing protein [Candidatus Rokubacteria bacterium]|nr:PIN domain-containing protein [Candidatus Rokubacteria bacterium]